MKSEKKTTKQSITPPASTAAPETSPKRKTRAAPAAKASPAIPSILLEGDSPAPAPVSGPGQRYALGPKPPAEHFPEAGELPESYGTQRLTLTARDPHWLYAHWDLSNEQLRKYNALSVDGHLVVRIYAERVAGQPRAQVHVHPESRNWFIHVDQAGATYIAELGYYLKGGKWVKVSTSSATFAPPDQLSEDTTADFATIPPDISFERLLSLLKTALRDNVPLVEAIMQLRSTGLRNLPDVASLRSDTWTAAQERALAESVSMDTVRRVWIGSLEITELIRRQLIQEISSAAASMFSVPASWSGVLSSISSPFGRKERARGFWFNVNAELIIYGATEPDAKVTIGGRQIKLRPDGTFSYRFSLPDGDYNLPAVATSADKVESRAANLSFMRHTDYSGEVGAHPQDPALKPPLVSHVS